MEITVRHAEPSDAEALHRIMSGPKAAGTLQLPLQPVEVWRKRLAEPPEGLFMLVACVEGEVVGNLGLHDRLTHPLPTSAGPRGNSPLHALALALRTITGWLQRLGTPEFRIPVSQGPGSLDALAKLLGGQRVEEESKRGRQN